MALGYYDVFHTFFALTSFLGLVTLRRTIKKELNQTNVTNLALRMVYIITITLGVFTFSELFFILSELFEFTEIFQNSFSGEVACTVLSGLGNFACAASVLWYATVAWLLLMILNGYRGVWSKKTIIRQHVIVWTISFLMCMAQLWRYIALGNPLHYCNAIQDYRDKTADIIFYFPIICAMLLSAIVLINSLYLLKRQKTMLDITIFVGCFIVIWFPPTVRVIVEWIGYTSSLLDDMSAIASSLAGIGHFLVWNIVAHPKGRNVRSISTFEDVILDQHMRHRSLLISTLCVRSEQNHGSLSLYGSTFGSDHMAPESYKINRLTRAVSDAEKKSPMRFSRRLPSSENTF